MERDHPRSSRYEHPLLPREVQEEFRRQGHWEGLTLARIVHLVVVLSSDRGSCPMDSYGTRRRGLPVGCAPKG
jgi:hypothetical protein